MGLSCTARVEDIHSATLDLIGWDNRMEACISCEAFEMLAVSFS